MGWVSIIHRATGALLFLSIPLLLYLLGLSLSSAEGFARVTAVVGSLPFRLVGLLLIWAVMHHLLAGLRFLLIDLDLGVDLSKAKASALGVIVGGVALAIVGGLLW